MWTVVLAFALAAAPDDATRGQQLMQAKGCFACHSTDGSKRSGPSFRDLQSQWGRTKNVSTRDGAAEVLVDEASLIPT